jgi:hypothetical protein
MSFGGQAGKWKLRDLAMGSLLIGPVFRILRRLPAFRLMPKIPQVRLFAIR